MTDMLKQINWFYFSQFSCILSLQSTFFVFLFGYAMNYFCNLFGTYTITYSRVIVYYEVSRNHFYIRLSNLSAKSFCLLGYK
jgi:hypothetical protein